MVDLQFREKKGVLVMYNEEEIKKQFPHKKFNHIYYMDDQQINSLYSQLTSNISSKTVENETAGEITVNVPLPILPFLKKLFHNSISMEAKTDASRHTEYTVEKDVTSRFHDVLEAIHEKNYKDIDYLIDHYMKDTNHIFVIGKGTFGPIEQDSNLFPTMRNVFNDVDLSIFNDTIVFFHGEIDQKSNYSELWHRLNKPLDTGRGGNKYQKTIEPREEDITPHTFRRRVFLVCEKPHLVDSWGFRLTFSRSFRFLGMITKKKDIYYLIPYAVWGCNLIL